MSSLDVLYAGTGLGEAEGSITASLDIVAVHGLNPSGSETHAFDTWEDKKSRNLWLRDKIPLQQPDARIFLYDYNSSPVFGNSQGRFIEEANLFLELLRHERKKVGILPERSTPGTYACQKGCQTSVDLAGTQLGWDTNQTSIIYS
ncbi:hypothetical protein BDR22DRAFT_644006 [Usnea florida]